MDMATRRTKKQDNSGDEASDDRLIEASELTLHEMQDAMATMMQASTKMMQAFIDMRLSYLKVMRAGLEDPQATMDMMVRNARDMAKMSKDMGRKE